MRAVRLLALALTLLLAQLALASHGIAHALSDQDETCVECLALPGFAALPATPAPLAAPAPKRAQEAVAVPPAPSFALARFYPTRAPPPRSVVV